MAIVVDIFRWAEILVFAFLFFSALYLLIFGLAGMFRYRPAPANLANREQRKVAVLIPGYKEDNVILETATEALKQDYPSHLFDVYVIADSFGEVTLAKLRTMDLRVVEVVFEKSSKAKALNLALSRIPGDYDVVVILDADNLMEPGFLRHINDAFDRGFKAVQGHRVAKNMNTRFARLDAISEEVNNNIFREGHRVLGLSSALIGSGMAFDFNLFREQMSHVTAHGEDKELEMRLLGAGIRIEYLPEALVLDEKIQHQEVFARQRKRWLAAQFAMFRQYAGAGLLQLLTRGNLDLFDKVIQMVLPPRLLLLGVATLLAALAITLGLIPATAGMMTVPSWLYALLLLATATAILVSVPGKHYSRETLKAIGSLPGAFLVMFSLLFRLRGAGKTFIHTPHGTTQPVNPEKDENRH